MAQRPSSTGSITALDSMSNLSSVAGNCLLKSAHGSGESRVRKHDVDGHAQFRFKAAGETFRPRLEEIDVARHLAGIGEKRAALLRQHRKMSAAIEQFHTELTFKIGHRLTHDGLRATQAAAGRRETALICGRDERAQLIQ